MHKVKKISQEPVIHRFLQHVLSSPKNKALWINNNYYSYEQLAQIVHTIYKRIPNHNTYEQIGICGNDDVYTYAGILAIQLHGAAYVPLNTKFPAARNKKIVEQCGLKLILSSTVNGDLEKYAPDAKVISTHFDLKKLSSLSVAEVSDLIHNYKASSRIAYILFTSGSTGEPKGVPVSHSNLQHFFDFFLRNYDFNSSDKFLQVYELTFDVSVFSFFMPLLVGACCYVVPDNDIKFVRIPQLLNEHRITVLSMVPGILRYLEKYLDEMQFEWLRYSFFSGDALMHDLAVKWKKSMPNGQIHNFYGPTETTIVCTSYPWTESQSAKESVNGIVPLGKPFDGMHVLVVDEANKPAEKGELCFSGTQVISSYLNNLNEHSFFDHEGKRYYKTGDIVSFNANGNLAFYGRTDNQVKINGYRVELDEIERTIEKIINSRCIVLCQNNEKHLNKLIAFVETGDLDEQQLLKNLASILPSFMLPHQVLAVEKFPLNLNQKTDKHLLLKYVK